jgi:hypothetical protein
MMTQNEQRRLALLDLVQRHNGVNGRGGIARIASTIGKAPDYISRLLYEDGKAGKKNIGIEVLDALDKHFPGWQKKSLQAEPTPLPQPASVTPLPLAGRLKDLVDIARRLSDTGQDRLIGYAHGLLEQFPAQANPASSSSSRPSARAAGYKKTGAK